MNCPSDGTTLLMSERQGVEIDYCPECRGIWLDRGELDKILERARVESQSFAEQREAPQAPAAAPQPAAPAAPAPGNSGYREDHGYAREDHRYGDRRRDGYGDPRSRRRKSPFDFLGEIFD